MLADFYTAYMDVGEGREQDVVALKVFIYAYKLSAFALHANNTSTIWVATDYAG